MPIAHDALQEKILAQYAAEHAALGDAGTLALLDKGRQWELAPALSAGGIVVFPHTSVADCGPQVAAAVHAALDSGADRVLVISVLHAFTPEMDEARMAVANGADPRSFRHWGIQGPGLTRGDEWRSDHALMSFRHFWAAETKRRGVKGPQVIERYPYLAGGKPWELPGIDELAALAEQAVIVSTADVFHHGIGYGTPPEEAHWPDAEGLAYAQACIEEGIELLAVGDYWGYNQHCVRVKSDARDAGQVIRCLRGPMNGAILDLGYTDATALYDAPPPTWVAGALVEWSPTL